MQCPVCVCMRECFMTHKWVLGRQSIGLRVSEAMSFEEEYRIPKINRFTNALNILKYNLLSAFV